MLKSGGTFGFPDYGEAVLLASRQRPWVCPTPQDDASLAARSGMRRLRTLHCDVLPTYIVAPLPPPSSLQFPRSLNDGRTSPEVARAPRLQLWSPAPPAPTELWPQRGAEKPQRPFRGLLDMKLFNLHVQASTFTHTYHCHELTSNAGKSHMKY